MSRNQDAERAARVGRRVGENLACQEATDITGLETESTKVAPEAIRAWEQTRKELETLMGTKCLEQWIGGARPLKLEEDWLTLQVANGYFRDQLLEVFRLHGKSPEDFKLRLVVEECGNEPSTALLGSSMPESEEAWSE